MHVTVELGGSGHRGLLLQKLLVRSTLPLSPSPLSSATYTQRMRRNVRHSHRLTLYSSLHYTVNKSGTSLNNTHTSQTECFSLLPRSGTRWYLFGLGGHISTPPRQPPSPPLLFVHLFNFTHLFSLSIYITSKCLGFHQNGTGQKLYTVIPNQHAIIWCFAHWLLSTIKWLIANH